MALDNIEKLIEKYFEGETSLKEEAQLRTYFTANKVPAHLEAYQDLFGYFESKANESFKKPLLPVKNKRFSRKWLSLVASVILLISLFVYNKNERKKEQLAQSYQSTQQALQLISKNLNKGAFAMAQLQEFEKTKTMVFKENNDK